MIETGILTSDDRVELLEGWIVNKMSHNPPHASSLGRVRRRVDKVLPDNWTMRIQVPITLSIASRNRTLLSPEAKRKSMTTRHPEPADLGVLIEVGDSSVLDDRRYKGEFTQKKKSPSSG